MTISTISRAQLLERMISRLNRRTVFLNSISDKYWRARRLLFVAGALLALFACRFSGTTRGVVLAILFVAAFLAVALYHRRVQDSLTRNALMIEIKRVQLARVHLDWDKMPVSTSPHEDPTHESHPETAHPFETDLDITGERSLLRLLDSAVTIEGSRRLSSWLLNTTPEAPLIAHRQSLVRELTGHALFRDKLQLLSAVAGNEARTGRGNNSGRWKSGMLIKWIGRSVHEKSLLPTVVLLAGLSLLNITLAVLAFLEIIPQVWPIAFMIYLGVMIARQSQIASAFDELQDLEKALMRFKAVFEYLETRGCHNTPGLAKICSPFLDKEKRPSAEVRKLQILAAALGLRTNALLWLLAHAIVPWDFYFTHRLELVKQDLAQLLPRWLDAWYELEALNSLANFAYLNPEYTFPVVAEATKPHGFEAHGLCHPLLKPDAKVCNDFALNDEQKIVVLTGSNMAGKSTFLRTVGVNLSLAHAGAPVNAASLQTSLFRVFTCIKVSDSVQDGLSYFYAEVKRLKGLLSATEADDPLPVLFLIDEIFRGTNSRERLIGSRAYIRALAERLSLGLVATHDLELVKLADEIRGVANFHFREDVRGGKMVFDYQLRAGPCPTTNALQIMRLEGLPVA